MPLNPSSTPISRAKARAFRLLKKSALTFLLLLRLDSLASIGLITRNRCREGYILTQAGHQLLMPEAEPDDPSAGDMEEIPPYPSIIIINTVNKDIEDSLITIIEPDTEEIPPEASEAIWIALRKAGNPRTEKLACLPHPPACPAAQWQRQQKFNHHSIIIYNAR